MVEAFCWLQGSYVASLESQPSMSRQTIEAAATRAVGVSRRALARLILVWTQRELAMSQSADSDFARLVEPHIGALRRTAYRLLRNSIDAEDLVQEVCLRAYEHRDELGRLRSPRAWLFRVQYNLHIDVMRRRDGPPIASLDGEAAPEGANLLAPDDPAVDAAAIELAERLSAVWPELNRDQQALLAYYAEGYSLNEICDITGLPRSALKARLHRARTRLGKLLRAGRAEHHYAVTSGESA